MDARSTQAETQDDLYRRIFGDWLTAVPASRVRLDNLASLLDSFADESSGPEQEALRHHFYHRILTSTAGIVIAQIFTIFINSTLKIICSQLSMYKCRNYINLKGLFSEICLAESGLIR